MPIYVYQRYVIPASKEAWHVGQWRESSLHNKHWSFEKTFTEKVKGTEQTIETAKRQKWQTG